MTSALAIRLASDADREALRALFHETEAFYRTAHAEAAVREKAIDRLTGPGDPRCLIAYEGERPLAYACFAIVVPPLAGALFLKELYVAEAARGTGVGAALMKALAELARKEGCKRFDWTTDADLPEAQRFYARLGARPLEGKIYYRVEASELDAFIAGETGQRASGRSG